MKKRALGLTLLLIPIALVFLWKGKTPRPREEASAPAAIDLPMAHAMKSVEKKVPPRKAKATEAAPEEPRWADFRQALEGVAHLDDRDQSGLDRLYEGIREEIARDPDSFARFYRSRFDRLQKADFRQSLFLTKALVAYHPQPAPIIAGLLQTPQDDVRTADGHHSPSPKVNMLKTFALDEWRHAHAGQDIDAQDSAVLQPEVARLARSEPDLAVVRASLQVLRLTSENPEQALRAAIAGRGPNEAFAYSDLIPAQR